MAKALFFPQGCENGKCSKVQDGLFLFVLLVLFFATSFFVIRNKSP